uniref:RIMS-binding protein 1/2/3 Fn3 domain-containing protein n=1 Tax=Iconisemion striatum TaxID=60296 RepID=A0A1A7XYL3_9TELE
MSRQSQYFENFKVQLQHKLSLAQDREQTLQNRIYTLEKQLLDMTVSAATGTATIGAVRITARTVTRTEDQDKLPSMRGEGEGEEEKKEERRKQWQPHVVEERSNVNEGKLETDVDQGGSKDAKHASNEARLQSFIISLQEDLKVLLEREEDGLMERRKLLEQLQESQENSLFLGGKVEEMKAEIHQLRLSESFLMQEVEELRGENQKLQQILRDVANTTPLQSSTKPESTSPRASYSPAVPLNTRSDVSAVGKSSSGGLGEVQPTVDHQSAAEPLQNDTQNYLSAKSKTKANHDSLNPLNQLKFKPKSDFQSLSVTTEFLNDFKLGNMEENPSEESDALREAFQSLGFGEDHHTLREKCQHLQELLQKTQAQLEAVAQENAQLKLQLRMNAEAPQQVAEQWASREKIITPSTFDRDDHLLSLPARDDAVPAQDDLIQALNQENRALAERIQELLAHIELREKEVAKEQTQLKEKISRMKLDGVRLAHDNQEQASLIFELNKKTEDDLNTIMELQQKLEDIKAESQVKQQLRGQWESEHPAGISGMFLHNKQEHVDSVVSRVLKGDDEEPSVFSQKVKGLTTAPSSCCKNQPELLQTSTQTGVHVGSLTEQVAPLSSSFQSLKSEQEELTANISSLREQQKDVTLSVQTQTEEKQQLTRAVWALKEQKDNICQSLSSLRQEKELLSRAVCGLKDERDQFLKSSSGLKEAKEQLTESLSSLQREKETVMKSLSNGKEERDRIVQSLQGLQAENDQLSQTVLHLKEQRDQLADSLRCLTEQRDQKKLNLTLKEDHDQLVLSVSSLKEEKGKIEHSISCLRQEENLIMQQILDLKEERLSHQTPLIQMQQPSDPCSADITGKTRDRTGDHTATGSETSNHRDTFTQTHNDLMEETDALRAELQKSQQEVDRMHSEAKRLHSELSESETRCGEAEKKACQASEQLIRLTESVSLMEDLMKENKNLTVQGKELQNKLTVLLREKNNALSLKAQTDEQNSILTAQLKAKSVALEELNSEYIALKRGRSSRNDANAAFDSLRARYNDIRAKYDSLLKQKSQTDVEIAPLKAKLSCLVLKCQQRNSLLVEMMKSMQRQVCVDPRLTQQVKHLLSDAALQEYAAAFTPGSYMQTQNCCSEFTQDFFSKFHRRYNRFTRDETCPVVSVCVSKQDGVSAESESQCRKRENYSSVFVTETSANLQAAAETLKKTSPGPASPVQERPSAPPFVPLKDETRTDMTQLCPASGLSNLPERSGFQHLDINQKSSSGLTKLGKSPTSLFSCTRVSPSRRLSSPEKIINLHEQLQKTLISNIQAPESRGQGQEPRRGLSVSAQTDLNSANTTKHNLSYNLQLSNSVVTAKPASSDKPATLFNAVASRSANVSSMFTNHHLKVDGFKTLSSSSDFALASLTPSKDKINSCEATQVMKPKQTTVHDVSNATHAASMLNTPTVPKVNVSVMTSKVDNAALTPDSFALCSQAAHSSLDPSKRSATTSLEKTSRPKPEAPAEVRSVEVIKRVGQSSLLIGWQRPPLDELGCSNDTFVYGYRVFVNGDFHKSVMSSACTKCILENVDLRVPVHISVQTLGSNGLPSNSIQIIYNTLNRSEQK